MPPGLIHKDGRIYFIKLVSHNIPDKEAHKQIIYESNTMESFTREIQGHIKQYDAISRSEWKKITNHIIRQYQKIDSQQFNTGFNVIIVKGPSASDTKYTRHDLITRNLWSKPEIVTTQELNTMPMHEKPWGTAIDSWRS
jgi:hypothetical protein